MKLDRKGGQRKANGSRGFSLFGFSLILQRRDALQARRNSIGCVSFPLIAHVALYPFQVLCAKTDDAITRLPFQNLAAAAEFLIDLVSGRSFQLTNQFADSNRGGDAQTQMHMRFNTADFMDENAWGINTSAAQVMVDNSFDLGNQKRSAFLDVPGDMEVDLGVIISGHGFSL